MQISSRAVMFWGCRWATRTFNSLQRFSMGLRSGDWLGHSRTLKCFLRSHSFVARAVCLGSLSCWKIQPRFIFNALADGRRFSLKITRYMAPFILSFTQISRPGPFAEKQPQSMMLPPPCFTVGMVFFGCNSAFFLLQTRQVEFLPKSDILVSSDHMPFSQSSSGSSKCSLANFRRAWTCTGLSRGTRLALQDLSPWRRSVLLMVAFVTLVPALCRSFTAPLKKLEWTLLRGVIKRVNSWLGICLYILWTWTIGDMEIKLNTKKVPSSPLLLREHRGGGIHFNSNGLVTVRMDYEWCCTKGLLQLLKNLYGCRRPGQKQSFKRSREISGLVMELIEDEADIEVS